MQALAMNQVTINPEVENYRRRTKHVAMGFIAILGLIIAILILWTINASHHTRNLESLAEHQYQTRLLANMIYAVQNRSLSLHQMLGKTDPFEQDDEYIKFRQFAELYLKNREQLLATNLSLQEHQILDDADKLANLGGLTLEHIANMITQGEFTPARKLLYNEATPNQIALTEKLRSIFESQRNIVETELQAATQEHVTTYWFIFFLGSVSLLLGIFTIYVVKRTARSEAKLFDQSTWIRSLYEISSMSGLTPDEQISETLKLGCKLLGMEIGKVCQMDLNRQTNTFINVVAPDEYSIKSGQEIPLQKSFCNFTLNATGPIAIPNVEDSKYANIPCYEFTHIKSHISMPLLVNHSRFGSINFSSTNTRAEFTQNEFELLKLITNWISVTIERKISQQISVAKETAEAANQTKSHFLASMSHELRTPLNAILGYNELLMDDVKEDGNAKYLADLQKVEVAGNHLLSLINDVLDLSKIEAGKMALYLEDFPLKPLIDEVCSTLVPIIEKNRNNFSFDYDDSINIIRSDLTKLRQILFNLLSNACKFTEDGPIKLTVTSVQIDNNHLFKVTVKDSGIGMTKEQLNKLFISFSQAEDNIQRKYGGSGLGLAITNRLCNLLGGSVSAESVPGVGSTFTAILPINVTEKTAEYTTNPNDNDYASFRRA